MQIHESIIFELVGVRFAYPGGPPVLDGLDFSVRKGERAGLVGPNGSGKTTLFHLMMGLVRPTSGQVRIFGRDMAGESDFREVRQRVGFLFQNSDDQLFCPTVLDDVAFGPLNLGRSQDEAAQAARKTLQMLGISDLETRISHRLSHGEKKLVALAGILAMEPEVLILDEPTAGLDKAMSERLVSILADLNLTCIITSHELDFLNRVTSVLYGMDRGRIDMTRKVAVHSHVHLHTGGEYQHSHEDLLKTSWKKG